MMKIRCCRLVGSTIAAWPIGAAANAQAPIATL
ncbi:hypothetical protein J2Y70_000483 [Xanthomonas translucens]|nr:hypothetical protein [Xanthomonas translucens]